MRTIDVRLTYDEKKTNYVMDEFDIQDAVALDGITVIRLPDNEYKIKRLKELCMELWQHADYSNDLDRNVMESKLKDEGVII